VGRFQETWGVGCGGAGEQGGFKEVFLSFIAGGAPPVGLLSRNIFYNPYIARLSGNEAKCVSLICC